MPTFLPLRYIIREVKGEWRVEFRPLAGQIVAPSPEAALLKAKGLFPQFAASLAIGPVANRALPAKQQEEALA